MFKLWRRFGGRCHLCGLPVPHPILELEAVNNDNAPSADHATTRADGGRRGKNLRLAHRWCNERRGRVPLAHALRRRIRAEASAHFRLTPAEPSTGEGVTLTSETALFRWRHVGCLPCLGLVPFQQVCWEQCPFVGVSSEGVGMESGDSPPLRVLCVDDLPDVADSAALLFQTVGFEARACYDGSAALALAATFQPSVCFIDLNMPGMDGDEVANRLRDLLGGPMPVMVAVTARDDPDSCERVAAAFDLHLVKPVDPFKLVRVVDAVWRAWDAILAGTLPVKDALARAE